LSFTTLRGGFLAAVLDFAVGFALAFAFVLRVAILFPQRVVPAKAGIQ
jgi:acyl-coenzyme A thioesterase PaaI-like protein